MSPYQMVRLKGQETAIVASDIGSSVIVAFLCVATRQRNEPHHRPLNPEISLHLGDSRSAGPEPLDGELLRHGPRWTDDLKPPFREYNDIAIVIGRKLGRRPGP